jgi:hypothetical protein
MTDTEMQGSIVVSNRLRTPLTLVLEPWAEETKVGPGHRVSVAFKGPQGGRIEVEVKGDVLVVYGWQGSVLSDPVAETPDNDRGSSR